HGERRLTRDELQASDLRPQASGVRPQASGVGPQTSGVRPRTSDLMHARGRLSSTSCARTTFPPRSARPWKSGPFRACPELAEGAASIMPNHCGLQPLRNAVASLRSEVRGLRSASFLLPLSFHTPRRIQFLVLRGIFLVRQQLAMIFRRAVHAVKEIGQNEFVL